MRYFLAGRRRETNEVSIIEVDMSSSKNPIRSLRASMKDKMNIKVQLGIEIVDPLLGLILTQDDNPTSD